MAIVTSPVCEHDALPQNHWAVWSASVLVGTVLLSAAPEGWHVPYSGQKLLLHGAIWEWLGKEW